MSKPEEGESSQKNVLTGFTPRIYPRPEYISVWQHMHMMGKEILYQSGFIGTILTLLCYPVYQFVINWLREVIGTDISDKLLFTVVFNATHIITYVFWNSLFGICDYYGYLQHFKLSRKSYMQPKSSLIIQTLVTAFISQVVVNPLLTYYWLYDAYKSFGMTSVDAPLPSTVEMFFVYCISNFFNSFFFYWAHRLFHHSMLYSTFHKQHHEYRGTMGISAEHAGNLLIKYWFHQVIKP